MWLRVKIKKKMASKLIYRLKRKLRFRSNASSSGTSGKPRLCVFRSNRYIYAQLIDDDSRKVIVSVNSLQKDIKEKGKYNNCNVSSAKKVGEILGKSAKDKGIETVVFDRNGFPYTGRIKALADGVRSAGLKF